MIERVLKRRPTSETDAQRELVLGATVALLLTFTCTLVVSALVGALVKASLGDRVFGWAPVDVFKLVVCSGFILLATRQFLRARDPRPWHRRKRQKLQRGLALFLRRLGGAQACGYCRDVLSDDVLSCPACAASYHAECAEELGRCGTIGCEALGSAPPRRAGGLEKLG